MAPLANAGAHGHLAVAAGNAVFGGNMAVTLCAAA